MVGIAFVFLCLRGWVRFIRRTRINLSDVFVSFAWVGFVADSAGHTILLHLGLELTPSKQSTVDVNADPHKLVQVYKVCVSKECIPVLLYFGFGVIFVTMVVWFFMALFWDGLMVDYLRIGHCVSCDIMAH